MACLLSCLFFKIHKFSSFKNTIFHSRHSIENQPNLVANINFLNRELALAHGSARVCSGSRGEYPYPTSRIKGSAL